MGLRSSRSASRRHRGFSLAEIMLAMSVWAAAFLSVFSLYSTCRAAVVSSKNILIATNIAQTQIETMKFVAFTNVNSMAEQTVNVSATMNGATVVQTFYYTITVTKLMSDTVKDMVVEVNWQEKGFNSMPGKTTWRSVKMESMVAQ